MKLKQCVLAFLGITMLLPIASQGQEEGGKWWQLRNRVKVEYDDNIRQESEDEDSSLKIVEELELQVNLNLDSTFVSFRYRPSYVYWFDREEDDTDFHHAIDAIVNHRFSPTFSVSLKDTFQFAELPELIERGLAVREVNDYLHNDLLGSVDLGMGANTRLGLSARYTFIDYDDAVVAANEDFDIYALGLTLSQRISPQTALRGELRYEDVSYDTTINRDTDGYYIGVGGEHTFSQNFLGDLRVGLQHKEIQDATEDSIDSPYVDASVTFLPTPGTRISTGIGFSQFEANVYPYSNQERFRAFASFVRDLTARVTWYSTLSLTKSQYDNSELSASAVSEAGTETAVADGDEDIFRLGTRFSYRMNHSHALEAGLSYLTFDSDVRRDYDRSRLSLAWKTQL